jgi:hypothetical protein
MVFMLSLKERRYIKPDETLGPHVDSNPPALSSAEGPLAGFAEQFSFDVDTTGSDDSTQVHDELTRAAVEELGISPSSF